MGMEDGSPEHATTLELELVQHEFSFHSFRHDGMLRIHQKLAANILGKAILIGHSSVAPTKGLDGDVGRGAAICASTSTSRRN